MHNSLFVNANGLDLFTIDAGTGQPVVLLHGSMATHAVWLPYLDALASRYRVLIPDLRGHGKTVFAGESMTVDELAADVIAFLQALEIDQAILCGWSGGGDIALQVAIQAPQRIKRLIVGGVTTELSPQYHQTLLAMGLQADGSANLERMQQAIPDLIATWQAVHTQHATHWQTLIGQIGAEMVNPTLPNPADLAALDIPTLLLWGDRDQFLPLEQAVTLYRTLPDAQLAVIPNADHFVTRTHVDAVAALIAGFVDNNHDNR